MFESIINFFKNLGKSDKKDNNSRDTAKERLHLVLMQDRANVSADFLDLMRQEIIDVIKKYVEIDESDIDVRMTNKQNDDGSNGTPLLYANIPIINIKNDILIEKKKEAEKTKSESMTKTEDERQDERVEENKFNDNNTEDIKVKALDNNYNEQYTEEKNEPSNEESYASQS